MADVNPRRFTFYGLRRALALHSRCSTDLACAAGLTVRTAVRAGQLMVRPAAVHPDLGADAAAVGELRSSGVASRSAAAAVFLETASAQHIERARCIRSLLCHCDTFAKAMAFNISVPAALAS